MDIHVFYLDQLSFAMLCITSIVGLSVFSFSTRYLDGDAQRRNFLCNVTLFGAASALISISDHSVMFLLAWALTSVILVKLMIHKMSWKASVASGMIAAKNLVLSFLMIAASMVLLSYSTGEISIQKIISTRHDSPLVIISFICLFLGVMVHSGLWPFHSWLLSSLNAPTPVSGIMHAVFVSGGGFLLIRLSPLYSYFPYRQDVVFIGGIFSALVAMLWKLMQSDVKRMLACSTMAHMGFVMMLCGLGLFPAAVAHLCWHAFFKAHLFLGSGAVAQEKKWDVHYPPTLFISVLSFLCGICGSIACAWASHKNVFLLNTDLFLLFIAFVAGAQASLVVLSNTSLKNIGGALMGAVGVGALYGASAYSLEKFLEPLNLMNHQPLRWLHIAGALLLGLSWSCIVFYNYLEKALQRYPFLQKWYVFMLNASQPHASTVTAHRNHYRHL